MKSDGIKTLPPLKKDILQGDLFICDLSDAPLKDDMASMEHPVYSLSKKPDTVERVYEHNGNTLTVTPSIVGAATIYDKDILIYATSKMMQNKNAGKPLSRKIIFEAQECLKFIKRTSRTGRPGGADYRLLEKSLKRLKGTMLTTNIKTGGKIQTEIFGLIESATIYREQADGKVLEWGVTLSDWLYNAILGDEVLTLHPDYFLLSSPTEKRIYELARRHCGQRGLWQIRLETLHKKVGSQMVMRNFRGIVKGISKTNHLPDYHVIIDEKDLVTFTKKTGSDVGKKKAQKTARDQNNLPLFNMDVLLDDAVDIKARQLAADKNLDYYNLKNEFAAFVNSRGYPENINAAFLGFIKKKKPL